MSRRKISNELWAMLEPLIPEFVPSAKGGRRRSVDDRAALNGILYVLHIGFRGSIYRRNRDSVAG